MSLQANDKEPENMGLLELASGASVWRGYDYYKENKVQNLIDIGNGQFTATIKGTMNEPYSILIDIHHPRKSKCNCPHADGKRIICKHMIATYFASHPLEAIKFYNDYVKWQQEEEEKEEKIADKVVDYINSMKKVELAQALIELLFDGPEWQYERFIREHDLEEYD